MIPLVLEPQEYQNLPAYMSLIAISLIPYVMVRYFALILIHEKKTHLLNKIYSIKLVSMALLFYWLIPKYGIDGILYTAIISNTINAMIFFQSVDKLSRPILEKRSFLMISLSLILLSASLLLENRYYLQIFSIISNLIVFEVILKSHFHYFSNQILPRK